MTEPTTVNVGLVVANTGDLVGTWATGCTNPDFVAIDGLFGGVQAITASNAPITLTSPAAFTPTPSGGPTQAQNAVIRVSGTLTGNVQITLPLPGYIIIENLTTGAFALTFRAIGSGEIIGVEQGSQQHVYNDGTNVRFVNLPPVGSYLDVCDAATPLWVTSCTKPPYLNCDGTTFNATTYPYLNTKLGGNTLPDLRGRSAFYLNGGTGRLTTAGAGIDGNTRFAGGGTNGVTLSVGQLPSHSHGVTDPGHSHTIQVLANAVFNVAVSQGLTNGGTTSTGVSTTGISIQATGSGQLIQNAAPGIMSGIRLIRAG